MEPQTTAGAALWAAVRYLPLRYDSWSGKAMGLDWQVCLAACEGRLSRGAALKLLPWVEAGLLKAVIADSPDGD